MNSGTKTGAIKGTGKALNNLGMVTGIFGGVAMLNAQREDPNKYCGDCKRLLTEEGCWRACRFCDCIFNLNYSNDMKVFCFRVCPKHTP